MDADALGQLVHRQELGRQRNFTFGVIIHLIRFQQCFVRNSTYLLAALSNFAHPVRNCSHDNSRPRAANKSTESCFPIRGRVIGSVTANTALFRISKIHFKGLNTWASDGLAAGDRGYPRMAYNSLLPVRCGGDFSWLRKGL
jgi:hypothetical protein